MKLESTRRLETDSLLFAHTRWDAIPVLAGMMHCTYVIALWYYFPQLSWWALIPMGLLYSISISWNINGISHNFIHNPYFRSSILNHLFSLMESLTAGYSQTFYESVHRRHHMGNADLPDDDGRTIDPLSIYRHGHDNKPEPLLRYVFLSYFRDDPKEIFADIYRLNRFEAWWGVFEIVAFMSLYIALLIFDWRFMLYFLPFYYFGHSLSHLNGYFRHYGGNPDVPIAWGVSAYGKFYNWTWFNNGYHAEHHFRPSVHWTRMKDLRKELLPYQHEAGLRVITPPHALGFLDPNLPKLEFL